VLEAVTTTTSWPPAALIVTPAVLSSTSALNAKTFLIIYASPRVVDALLVLSAPDAADCRPTGEKACPSCASTSDAAGLFHV